MAAGCSVGLEQVRVRVLVQEEQVEAIPLAHRMVWVEDHGREQGWLAEALAAAVVAEEQEQPEWSKPEQEGPVGAEREG